MYDKGEMFAQAIKLLRCEKSGRYFNGHGWTADPDEAEVFLNANDAIRTCLEQGFGDVELVLRSRVSGAELLSAHLQ